MSASSMSAPNFDSKETCIPQISPCFMDPSLYTLWCLCLISLAVSNLSSRIGYDLSLHSPTQPLHAVGI